MSSEPDQPKSRLPLKAVNAEVAIAQVPSAFARHAKARREAIDVSQESVVRLLNYYGLNWHQTTLAKVEANTRAIKLNEAVALAAIYGISLDALIAGEDLEKVDGVQAEISKRKHPGYAGAALWKYERESGQ